MSQNNNPDINNKFLESIDNESSNWPNIDIKEWENIKKDRDLILKNLTEEKKQSFLLIETFLDNYFSKKRDLFKTSKEQRKQIKSIFNENKEIEAGKHVSNYETKYFPKTIAALKPFNFSSEESKSIIAMLEYMYIEKRLNLRLFRYIAETNWVGKDYLLKKIEELNKDNELEDYQVEAIWAYLKLWVFNEKDKELIENVDTFRKEELQVLLSFCENINWITKSDIQKFIKTISNVKSKNLNLFDLYLSSWPSSIEDVYKVLENISNIKIDEWKDELIFIQKYGFIYEFTKFFEWNNEITNYIMWIEWSQLYINKVSWVFLDYYHDNSNILNHSSAYKLIKYLFRISPEKLDKINENEDYSLDWVI